MLDAPDFQKVGHGGFGDSHNSIVWSMEWFQQRLYVGTIRDILWLFKMIGNYPYLDPYPVALPPLGAMDLRAQIWRYTPEEARWDQVYVAPLVRPSLRRAAAVLPWRRLVRFRRGARRERRRRAGVVVQRLLRLGLEWAQAGWELRLARDLGYRTMLVHTDARGIEALHVTALGMGGGRLLRTTDGVAFDVVTDGRVNELVGSAFRPLVSFRGRLYASPVGAYFSTYPAVLESDDPARGAVDPAAWRSVSPPGFHDPDNLGIFEMAAFRDHLYAGVANPSGFQIWKSDLSGRPPYQWRLIVRDGGHKGPSGIYAPVSMCAFGDWLYVGSGRAPSGLESFEPTPGELIRIAPDDTWEVVTGEARDTHQGFKAPVSGLPALFGSPFSMYVWRMAEHDGWLYAGTNDATTLLRYTPSHLIGPRAKRVVEAYGGIEPTVAAEGGFDLWRTQDGIRWTCVTRTGFGNPLNHGLRTLKSTPLGLFVGTQNFYTDVRDRATGEVSGGAEVWLGSDTRRRSA